MSERVSFDAKGYLVFGWFSGTFGGLLVGGAAFFSGLADQARPHTTAWLALGLALLVVGAASAAVLVPGSRTSVGRVLAVTAFGITLALPLLAISQ